MHKGWLAASIAWALFILLLCSIPGKDIPSLGWMQALSPDKWVHAFMFAVQYVLVFRALDRANGHWNWRSPAGIWAMAWCLFYGAATEIYQHLLLTDRYADIYDFVANTAGMIVGMFFYKWYGARFLRYR